MRPRRLISHPTRFESTTAASSWIAVTLGKREVIPAIERALIGMRVGGYRKLRASPHLAYRQEGIPGLIPEHAVLLVELWLRATGSD